MPYVVSVICHTSTNNIPAFPNGVFGRYETREAALEAAASLKISTSLSGSRGGIWMDIDVINDTPGATGPLRERVSDFGLMMGDVAKLPRWAQDEIRRLKQDADTSDAALVCALGAKETRIEINPYRTMIGGGDKGRCFVREVETIRFYFPEGRYIDVKLDDDELSIRGDERITIEPNSSNVVTIKPNAHR